MFNKYVLDESFFYIWPNYKIYVRQSNILPIKNLDFHEKYKLVNDWPELLSFRCNVQNKEFLKVYQTGMSRSEWQNDLYQYLD